MRFPDVRDRITPDTCQAAVCALMVALLSSASLAADIDRDGVADQRDRCPNEFALGMDFDHDGCIDSACSVEAYLRAHFTLWVPVGIDPMTFVPIAQLRVREDPRLQDVLAIAADACQFEQEGNSIGKTTALEDLITRLTSEELAIEETVLVSAVSQANAARDAELGLFERLGPQPNPMAACSAGMVSWSDPNAFTEPCAGPWQFDTYNWCRSDLCACEVEDCNARARHTHQGASVFIRIEDEITYKCNVEQCNNTCTVPGEHPTAEESRPIAASQCTAQAWRFAEEILGLGQADVLEILVDVLYVETTTSAGGLCDTLAHHEFECHYTIVEAHCPCGLRSNCRASDCGVSGPHFSGFNLSSNALAAELDSVGLPLAAAAVCTTSEPMVTNAADPTQRTLQVQEKLNALLARYDNGLLPPGRGGRALLALLERHLLVLADLEWSELRVDQRDRLMQLYLSAPSEPLCSSIELQALQATCAGYSAPLEPHWSIAASERSLDALAMFDPATSSGNPDKASLRETSYHCLDLHQETLNLPADACGDAYREHAGTLLDALLQQWFSTVTASDLVLLGDGTKPDGALLQLNSLWIALRMIDAWYSEIAAVASEDEAMAELSAVLSRFWEGVQQAAGGDPVVAIDDSISFQGSANEDAIRLFAEAGLQADRAVLRTLYSDPAPAAGVPLLFVTGDTLKNLTERLDGVTPFIDLACRYKQCSGNEQIESMELFEALSLLPDEAGLAALLGRTGLLIRPAYAQALSDVHAQHAILAHAFAATHEGAPLADLLTVEAHPSAASLQAAVQLGRSRWTTFTQSGLVAADHANRLHAGMGEHTRDLVLFGLNTGLSDLQSAITAYDQSRGQYVREILEQMATTQQMAHLEEQVNLRWQQYMDIHQDLDALRGRSQLDVLRFAEFAAQFQELLDAQDPFGAEFVKRYADTLTVAALDARYIPGDPVRDPVVGADPAGLAAKGWTVQGGEGDLVSLSVTGEWSPTCALRHGQRPSFLVLPRDGDPLTGPEGFRLTSEASNTMTWGSSDTYTYRDSTCAQMSASFGLSYQYIFVSLGGMFSQMLETCSESVGSKMRTFGSNLATSAAFQSGLRIRETPYYAEGVPAGALALVLVEPTTRELLDVYVLQRNSLVVLEQAADLYLVVNDLWHPTDSTCSNGQLTVAITQSSPASATAQSLLGAMQSTLDSLAVKAAELYETGPILPSELGALRASAWSELETRSPVPFGEYPDVYRSFFQRWLETQLAQLERRARMTELGRTARQLHVELDALQGDLALARSSARLLQLQSRWIMRNLSGNKLATPLEALRRLAIEEIFPVVHLRYPSVLIDIQGGQSTTLADLLNTDFTLPAVDAADLAHGFLTEVHTLLAAAQRRENTNVAKIALAFRQPGDCNPLFGPCTSTIRSVSATRAAEAWEPFDPQSTGAFGKLTLDPLDLYEGGTGYASLGCFDSVPVVRSMALVIQSDTALNEDDVNTGGRWIQGYVDPGMTFPQSGGPLTYWLNSDGWTHPKLDVLFTNNESEVLPTYNSYLARVYNQPGGEYHQGSGLAPFGTYFLEFRDPVTGELPSWPYMDFASAMYLVFEVEIQAGSKLTWLAPECSSTVVP